MLCVHLLKHHLVNLNLDRVQILYGVHLIFLSGIKQGNAVKLKQNVLTPYMHCVLHGTVIALEMRILYLQEVGLQYKLIRQLMVRPEYHPQVYDFDSVLAQLRPRVYLKEALLVQTLIHIIIE